MASFKMLQGEVDDYAKQMGQYFDLYDEYAQGVKSIQSGDKGYVMADPKKPDTYYNMTPAKDGGLQGGKAMTGTLSNDGSQVFVDKPGSKGALPGMADTSANTTDYRLLSAPTEPVAPTFTRSEATRLQNPPQTLAQREARAPGITDRLGVRPTNSWDSSTGILARVMSGKV